GGVLLVLVPFAWGVKLAAQKRLSFPTLRVACLLLALPAAATVAAWFTAPLSWPIMTGLGGYVGMFTTLKLTAWAGKAAAIAITTLWLLVFGYAAFGNRLRDWRHVWHFLANAFTTFVDGLSYFGVIWGKERNPAAEKAKREKKERIPRFSTPAPD